MSCNNAHHFEAERRPIKYAALRPVVWPASNPHRQAARLAILIPKDSYLLDQE